MSRVLVVEDEERIASFLVKGLTAHGYAVEHVALGADAVKRAGSFDLVVLDLGLPDLDGAEVVRRLRRAAIYVPIVVLTARDDLDQIVTMLDLGADDYLTKPFAFDELVARIRARLRPAHDEDAHVVEGAGMSLDLRTRRVAVDGVESDLTAREFSLLETLMRHGGQVLSRQQLLGRVWGLDFDPSSNVVDVYVRYLRQKIGEQRIETVRGAGYRFVDDAARR